jgi:hypothetical protein
MSLLKTLGLDRLIDAYESGSLPEDLKAHLCAVVDTAALETAAEDKRTTLETMLSAHQDLVRASPENLPKFENVLDYLSQDLRKLEEE